MVAIEGAKPHDHVVGFYERDDELIPAVVPFALSAIERGGTAIVVATAPHRRSIEAALAGVCDIEHLAERGRYVAVDAEELLSQFMVDGRPDPIAFLAVIGPMLDALTDEGPIHAFGEMVAVLWEAGNVPAAIELESMWNALAETRVFALYCAYSMESLEASGDLWAAKNLCDRHSDVIRLAPGRAVGVVDTPGADEFTRVFVPTSTVVRDVRAFVRDVLDVWDEDRLRAEAEVIVAELASNAVVHARSPFRVLLSRTDSEIRIAVRDASAARPENVRGHADRHGGRGISIVAALSDRWDTRSEIDGKTIWATLTRSP